MKRVYFTYNYQPMGIGYFTSALKNKDSVTKIFEFSTKFTHKQISKLENHLITVIQIAEKYLGSFVVNTKVRVINHPYLNKPCVALEQPYIEGIPLHGKNYAKQLNKAQRTQLKKLLDLNMIMQKETGYTADLNGHNLFVVGDKLYLVDTILSGKVVAERRRTTVKIPNREAKNLEQEYIN